MILPYLTERDPIASSEGTLDPLGMFPIADSLANRLVPGVRERQVHPRFLTIIAVALSVCSDFEEEVIAADGVSEPWQVFEWYVVEGLVRGSEMGKTLQGLPGIDKTRQAIKDRVPLNAGRYLKHRVRSGSTGFIVFFLVSWVLRNPAGWVRQVIICLLNGQKNRTFTAFMGLVMVMERILKGYCLMQ